MAVPTAASEPDANRYVPVVDQHQQEEPCQPDRLRTGSWTELPRTRRHALLAVRDRLLVALAFASGIYEAICFLSFGKVFTAFQTGNIVFLGLGAAGTRPPDGPDPVRVAISLVAFAAGAVVAVQILKAFDGDHEVEDHDVFQVWPRRVSIALSVALVVQLGFLAVWMATSPSSYVSNILVGLSAFALGLQMNAIRSLQVPPPRPQPPPSSAWRPVSQPGRSRPPRRVA
jgi:hypothetical protein